jgi:hypothetical protein
MICANCLKPMFWDSTGRVPIHTATNKPACTFRNRSQQLEAARLSKELQKTQKVNRGTPARSLVYGQ